MIKRLLLAVLVLLWAGTAAAELQVQQFIKVTTTMQAKSYLWFVAGPGGPIATMPMDGGKTVAFALQDGTKTLRGRRAAAETYSVTVVGATVTGELLQEVVTIGIPGPTPEPTPTPPPIPVPPLPPGPTPTPVPPGPTPEPPTPVPPEPKPGLISVLIVDETGDMGSPAYKPYLAVLNSTELIGYLATHCAKDATGRPDWRHWDKDTDTSHESGKWKGALDKVLKADPPVAGQPYLPRIAISNGVTGYAGPLPDSIQGTLELLRKWGGQ